MSQPVRLTDLSEKMADSSRSGSMTDLTGPRYRAESSRLLTLVVAAVGLIAIVAVIVAAIAMTRPTLPNVTVSSAAPQAPNCPPQQPSIIAAPSAGQAGGQQGASKIWSVAIGHDYGAHDYIDGKGYINGFGREMVQAVCKAAGVQCVTVWDKYKNCWDSEPGEHSFGGQGLFDGWYDGCAGWYTTVERIHVFAFSQPYLKTPNAYFFVKKDDTSFDPSDITGLKIGFIDGWASDEKCLARQNDVRGHMMNKPNVIHASDPEKIKEMLLGGKIDAVYTTQETMDPFVKSGELKQMGKSGGYSCLLAGNALMARKDSAFISIWNQGYSRMRANGDFQKLCQEAKTKHGARGDIDCLS